jgi:negative regulator of replication initiation
MLYKIDIDEDIWSFLKKHAEPFEDTPNTVLKRLLRVNGTAKSREGQTNASSITKAEIPSFSNSAPAALQQILEVIFLVKKLGHTRTEATNLVAEKRGIAPQTVIDKYCRQLNKQAYEIDRLLAEDVEVIKMLLEKRFFKHRDIIHNFFSLLR